MRIAGWNVNSIRARTEHVRKWLERTSVDVLLPKRQQSDPRKKAWKGKSREERDGLRI
jgi:exonuclease III